MTERKQLPDVVDIMSAEEFMICAKPGGFAGNIEDSNFVVIYDKKACEDHGMHLMKRAYKVLPDGYLEEVPVDEMIKLIISAIKSKVDVEQLLDQVMRSSGPITLVNTYNIIKNHPEVVKDASVKEGCLFIDLPNPTPGESNEHIYLRY